MEPIVVTSGSVVRASKLKSEIEIDETDEIRRLLFPDPFTQPINYGSCTNVILEPLNPNGTKESNFVVACLAQLHVYCTRIEGKRKDTTSRTQSPVTASHVLTMLCCSCTVTTVQ